MSLIVQYGDRLVEVARRVESTPERWLIGMRWIAIAGMLVTIVGGKLVAPALRAGPMLVVLASLVLVNVGWLLLHARRPPRSRDAALGAQIAVDLVMLGLILRLSGGLSNPFAPFLTFQVVLAGLLTSSRITLLVTALTVIVAAMQHGAEPLPLDGAALDPDRVRVLGRLIAVVALGLFLGFFVWVYARRLELLHEESARNEKLAALGRTVAAMCHELNTPLGSIVIAGKDLEHLGGAAGSADIQDLARTVQKSAARASDIISLLRGAVRPNARIEAVELAAFVTEWTHRELDRLGFRGERVVSAPIEARMPLLPTALAQILTNLLANAVDALQGVPSPRIEVSVSQRRTLVEVQIVDNGPGFSPAILPRLGEPFQTTKEDGTGLGLYVSSMLAERMGGRLAVDAGPGGGARLTLTFDTMEVAA